MQILFLSAWFPYPPDNGSKLRIFNLLRGLAAQHKVTLISFADQPPDEPPEPLKELCQEIHILPARSYNGKSARALLGLFSTRPRVLVARHAPAMEERIRQVLASQPYDLVIASQWYTAAYFKAFQGVPALFEEAEIGVFKDKVAQSASPLQRFRHQITALKMQRYFQDLLAHFGACTVVSEAERSLLMDMVPGYHQVEVIPNGVDLDDYRDVREKPEPDTLIFTGSFRYSANYGAMLWFLNEVYPQIRAEVPGVRLTITGDHAGLSLPTIRNLILTGSVKDVRPLIASSWASLAPLITGGGTRLKILEAMALRTPVIATSKGAEGLDVRHEEHLLIADTPQEFAAATIRLLGDPALRRRLAANALELMRERYATSVIQPRLLELAERVARGARAAADTSPAQDVAGHQLS